MNGYLPKRIKLKLWHPLKYRPLLLILLAIIFIGIAYLIEGIIDLNSQNITFNIIFTLAITLAVFIVTLEETRRLEYADALKKLLLEMKENRDNLDNFQPSLDQCFKEFKEKKSWNWMPKKSSYTNWADGNNFPLKYFPTSAYFNFVNGGYILDDKYLNIPKENIANFYQLCISFNIELQLIENMLYNQNGDEKSNLKPFYECAYDCSGNPSLPSNIMNLKSESINDKNSEFSNSKETNFSYENIERIHRFLKCDFFNRYAFNELNGGIIKNYKIMSDNLSDFFNFNKN